MCSDSIQPPRQVWPIVSVLVGTIVLVTCVAIALAGLRYAALLAAPDAVQADTLPVEPYDAISQLHIQATGLRVDSRDRNRFSMYLYAASQRYEWIGDKLLVRSLDGHLPELFAPGRGVQHPLRKDPLDTKPTTSLRDCLDPRDDGNPLPPAPPPKPPARDGKPPELT